MPSTPRRLKPLAARALAPILAAGLLAGGAGDPILQDAVSDAARGVHETFDVDYASLFAGKTPETAKTELVASLHGDARADITPVDISHILRSTAHTLETARASETYAWQSSRTGHQGWVRADGAPGNTCRTLFVSFQNKAGHTARGKSRACRLADGSWRLGGNHPGPYPVPAEDAGYGYE